MREAHRAPAQSRATAATAAVGMEPGSAISAEHHVEVQPARRAPSPRGGPRGHCRGAHPEIAAASYQEAPDCQLVAVAPSAEPGAIGARSAAPRRAGQDDGLDAGRAALVEQAPGHRVELGTGRADVVY